MNNNNKIKHTYRLLPCPNYDFKHIESWLADMASKGLKLSKQAIFFGITAFESTEPCKIRYCLTASKIDESLFTDETFPISDTLESNQSFAWHFVSRYNQFFIYSCEDETARDLNTIPQVQAQNSHLLRQKENRFLLNSIFWFILISVLYIRPYPLLSILDDFSLVLTLMLLILWCLATSLTRTFRLHQLRKKPKSDTKQSPQKISQLSSTLCHLNQLVFVALILLAGISYIHHFNNSNSLKIDLMNYDETLPFPTIVDLSHEYGLSRAGRFSYLESPYVNTVEFKSNILAPLMISYYEIAKIDFDDHSYFGGSLMIEYYEMISSFLAKQLAIELDARGKEEYRQDKTPIPLLGVDVDYSSAYGDEIPSLVLQHGNKVMYIVFNQHSPDHEMSLNEWSQIFAEYLKQ